ncbi:type II secretion system F family protein [Denitrobaculum tricleocarpae]|uniref:Type II secretion system F family protein n=1 Tax=Denitrobaculum tricleocarpae TaxID=2591009 RepID=A0A545TP94_9PROT|nr:type II secretion system F family protein [Denitrobaculum tricleocarpae]TQV79042.1 type II secretion system F family protein [Denitrobaculum tricleocarpae]
MDLSLLTNNDPTMTLILMCLPMLGGVMLIAAAFAGDGTNRNFKRRIKRATGDVRNVDQSVQTVVSVRRATADSRYALVDRLIKTLLPRPDLLRDRLERAGVKPALGRYLMMCLLSGVVAYMIGRIAFGFPNIIAGLFGLVGVIGVPHFALGIMAKRRQLQFIAHFPDAIDLMVRGLKAGLPITESMKSAGQEIPGPVGEELTRIFEAVKIGSKIEDALWDTANRLMIPEFNFFTVALSIQTETGGNLAETLSNLSDILRKRKQMKFKIKAMSSEAKASAYIIGSLPFIMFLLLFFINNEYVMTLWHDPRGNMMLAGGFVMFGVGIGTMYKMVKFEI